MWRWFIKRWHDPWRVRTNLAEKVTAFLTLVIAGIGILQWLVYRQQARIMGSDNPQTQKLIEAANINAEAAKQIAEASKRNATAAESFSTSADQIKDKMASAVDQLHTQAERMEASRKSTEKASSDALQASIDNFRLDQRAWLGVQSIQVESEGSGTIDNSLVGQARIRSLSIDLKGIHLVLKNTGKTPAAVQSFQGKLYTGKEGWDSHGFDIDKLDTRGWMGVINPPGVLIPEQTVKGDFSGFKLYGDGAIYPLIVAVVRVDYLDVWRKPHTTKLCIYLDPHQSNGNSFTYCPMTGSNSED